MKTGQCRRNILTTIFIIVFLIFFLASCSAKPVEHSESGSKENGDGLKIAMVTSPSGVDDGSFNEDNFDGIIRFIDKYPNATVKTVKEETGDPAVAVGAVANIVEDYDVIVTPGYQFAGISKVALEHPDKKFILIDSVPEPMGGKKEFENIYAMTFAEQESGFFAGMAAALETKTEKVAIVNGVAFPSNVNFQYGFESGVSYVNKAYDKNVNTVELPSFSGTDVTGGNVGGNYAGSFSDEATGKVIGDALIEKGVDIIFVAAGDTGKGVFSAVKEACCDVKVIGCDVDQYDDGIIGSKNIVITSALKLMAKNVEKSLNSVAAGTFKGGNVLLKADTNSVGIVIEAGRHQLTEDTINKIQEAFQLIKAGTIVPAANFNGYSSNSFPGLK